MALDRRDFLRSAALGTIAGAGGWLLPQAALALTKDQAASFVKSTMQEVASLVQGSGDAAKKAKELRAIMEKRGAMAEIARFVAGTAWRGMSQDQQARFTDAFTTFISSVYARRFEEYANEAKKGDLFKLGGVTDAGRKGMVVRTMINRVNGAPINVDWLVSDRPGHPVIADIIIEGVSLLITERDDIASMLQARNGNVDKLIKHLSAA